MAVNHLRRLLPQSLKYLYVLLVFKGTKLPLKSESLGVKLWLSP